MEVLHTSSGRKFRRRVYFKGTGAVLQGQAVCYDHTWGSTAVPNRAVTDPWEGRDAIVDVPSSGLAGTFAGVAEDAYPANANGQFIYILEPGSVALVLVANAINTTCGTTRLVFSHTNSVGKFIAVSAEVGAGCARALQTKTGDGALATLFLCKLETGTQSGGKT